MHSDLRSSSELSSPGAFSLKFSLLAGLTCLTVVLIGLVRVGSRPLSDPDTWWHLRVGEEFWGGWSLRSPETLSRMADSGWVARDWLPQITAAKFEFFFGLPGVAWLAGAMMIGFAVAAWFVGRRFADPIPTAVTVVVAVIGASASLSARPQLVSLVLLLLFVAAWMTTALDHRPRWWLIPLTVLWACSHGMWIVGVLVGAVVTTGIALEGVADKRAVLRLGIVPFAGVFLAMFTPAGPGVVSAAIQSSPLRQYITEWQPVDVLSSPAAMTTWLGITVVTLHYMRVGRVSWVRALLLLSAAGWAVLSWRTVALGAVTVAPLLAEVMQQWLHSRPVRIRPVERGSVVVLLALALVGLAAIVPVTAQEPAGYPTRMNERLSSLPQETVVLNAHELGGWLEWQHRQLTVVVDGNTPAYDVRHQERYILATHLRPGWRKFVEESGAEYALLDQSVPLKAGLQLIGWRQLARDGTYVLLGSPSVDMP